MFSLYLFTIIFVSLCLLTYQQPTQPEFSFAVAEVNYLTIDDLDCSHWIADFAAEVLSQPEPNTITADEIATVNTDSSNETNAESEAMTDVLEARVNEITKAMTKADILSDIKSRGWWESNLSKLSKRELAMVKAQRELLAA